MSVRPIAVYGATGYTGRLVTAELARRGIPAVLAGRSADKLRALADPHGFEARAASIDDPAALRRAFDGCAAVIACAGPFLTVGDPVVRAAIAAGCHYVDTTGETPFIQQVIEVHGPAARRAGVAAVSGMGFDYLPGDLVARLAAEGLGPLDELVVAYAVSGFGATRGTTRSALLMMGEGPARQPWGRTFDFGGALGERLVSSYPSGEAVTVPRHTDTAKVTTYLTTATVAPKRLERAMPLLTPPAAIAFRSRLVRAALDKAIDRLPEGPSEQARREVRWTVVAEPQPAGSSTPARRVTVSGPDIYGITAVTTVEGATRMAAEGYDRVGGLAPAEAYDARDFLAALAPHGVTVTEG